MRREYRIDSLEKVNDAVFADCYDLLYDEPFKKYLGIPSNEEAQLAAQDLLKDPNYSISDEIRKEIEELFQIKDLEGIDEAYEENIKIREEKETLSEKLNNIDRENDNAFDLKNLYEACDYTDEENRLLESIIDNTSAEDLFNILNEKYEESFLNEAPETNYSKFMKFFQDKEDPKVPSDGRYKRKTTPKGEFSNFKFERFPGGKVKIDNRYYPGDFVTLILRTGNKLPISLSYTEYRKNKQKYDKYKIVSTRLVDFKKRLNDKILVEVTDDDDNGNKYRKEEMTYGEWLQLPEYIHAKIIKYL